MTDKIEMLFKKPSQDRPGYTAQVKALLLCAVYSAWYWMRKTNAGKDGLIIKGVTRNHTRCSALRWQNHGRREMGKRTCRVAILAATCLLGACAGQEPGPTRLAQAPASETPPPGPPPAATQPAPTTAAAAQPAPPVLHFDHGSATIRSTDQAQLDAAARLFREGNPFVMVVMGETDTTGDPRANLLLSERRANAVAQGLIARGIPASRLQVLAKGQSELTSASGGSGSSSPASGDDDRRVEITWRVTRAGGS